VTPKAPTSVRWQRVASVSCGEIWQSGPLRVISALDIANLPKGGVGPQWHISVTRNGKRASDLELRRALRAFDMVGAEEDNHHPGNARHFFMPVDPAERVECECKTTEETVVERDGYRWSNSPVQCRGCEWERLFGRTCRLHGGAT
jgi:hypothetical protein